MTRKEYNISVDMHAKGLYLFLLKNMNDSETANDIVQDVFTRLWEKHENVQFEKAKSYIFTAGYRTMLNYFRDKKREASLTIQHEKEHYHDQHYTGLQEILDKAIEKLPEDQRSALLLRDYEGYSYEEIGQILNFSESQVKINIFRARKFLQQHLKSIEALI